MQYNDFAKRLRIRAIIKPSCVYLVYDGRKMDFPLDTSVNPGAPISEVLRRIMDVTYPSEQSYLEWCESNNLNTKDKSNMDKYEGAVTIGRGFSSRLLKLFGHNLQELFDIYEQSPTTH